MSDNAQFSGLCDRFRGFYPVVIDVETAGFNAKTDALLEIAAITLKMDEQGWLTPDTTLHFHVEPFEGANLQPEALAFISGHYETGEPLPKELLDKMLAAKNYQAAMFILRQLEFGLFDFRLHAEYKPEQGAKILETLAEIKKQVAVIPGPTWGRFPHAFSHIFAGGYAAGYYSYLWADVLAADAFSRFEEEGIFNRETGQSFLDNILTRGGSEEPMVLFKRFRGREPQLDAMLEHYGIKG